MYKSNVYKFLSINRDPTRITIATDKKWILIEHSEIPSFLKDLLEVDDEQLPAKNGTNATAIISDQMKQNVNSLSGILLSNIERLKDDPTYIKQAQQINNSARTIIEMARLELDVHKHSNR